MASIGINVGREGEHDPRLIRSLGATWIRIVATPGKDLSAYLQDVQAQGLKVLLVLARESGTDYDQYRKYLPVINAIQVGNEPDLDSPSSWGMAKDDFVTLGRMVREFFPEIAIVAGGLASGHPDWLDGMDLSWADAVACHPYAKDMTPNNDLPDATDLIAAYRGYGKPVIVSEWGWWGDEEGRAITEVGDMVDWAAETNLVEVFFYFCLTDAMVPPFGLLRADGSQKGRADEFKFRASLARNSPWPPVIDGNGQPEPPAKPNPWQFFSAEQIAEACRIPSQFRDNIRDTWPRLVEQLDHCGINDRPTQVAMAATVAIETARRFYPIHEFRNADGSIPDYWYGYDGGPDFHGRGDIQNTHRYNYQSLGPKIAELWGAGPDDPAFDLVSHPDNLLDPDMSAAAAAIYFRERGISAMAQRRDWAAVRRAVQGQAAPADSIESVRRDAEALWAMGAPAPTDPTPPSPNAELEGFRLALRTLRDKTIPDIRAQVDEADRIVRQFVGDA